MTDNTLAAKPNGSDVGDGHDFWPVLDAAAYQGLPGAVVEGLAPHTEADPAAVLLEFLAQIGNAIGRGPHYSVGADRHPCNLFVLLVGETALGRKGAAHAEIIRLMDGADPVWSANNISHGGLSSGEGLIRRLADPIDETSGVTDKRLLAVETEFGQVLAVMRRRGSILPGILRAVWDGRDLALVTRRNPLRATGPHVSVVAHITLAELRQSLDRLSLVNGFANRFLVAVVRRSRLLPFGGTLDAAAIGELTARIYASLAQARRLRRLAFDVAAASRWNLHYTELSSVLPAPALVNAVLARRAPQALRLAVLYASLDQQPQIAVPHLEAALAIIRYCTESARLVFGAAPATGDDVADQILDALHQRPHTRTELIGLFARHVNRDRLTRALGLLARHKLARPTRTPTRGRPRETWTAI